MQRPMQEYMRECMYLFPAVLNYQMLVSPDGVVNSPMIIGIRTDWTSAKNNMKNSMNGNKSFTTTPLIFMNAMINGPSNVEVKVDGANINNINVRWGFASRDHADFIPANIADVVRDLSRFPCWVSKHGDGGCRGSFGVGFMLLRSAEVNHLDELMYTNDDFVYSFTGALHMRLSFGMFIHIPNTTSVVSQLLRNANKMMLAPLTRQHLRSFADLTEGLLIKDALEASLSESFIPVFNYNPPRPQ